MLRETADPLDAAAVKNCMPLKKQTFCLRNAEASSIETNSAQRCTIDVPLLTGAKEKTYENFKSVLRLTASQAPGRMGPTRVRSGNPSRRRTAAAGCLRWPMAAARIARDRHAPPAVLAQASRGRDGRDHSGPGESAHSYGHHAFVRDDSPKGPLQRLLVVRLSNMSRIDPVYSTPDSASSGSSQSGVSYSK